MTMQRYLIDAEIKPLGSGGYFASCTNLEGCEVSGETFGQAIGHLLVVAEAIIKLRREGGLSLPPQYDGPEKTIVRTHLLLEIENTE